MLLQQSLPFVTITILRVVIIPFCFAIESQNVMRNVVSLLRQKQHCLLFVGDCSFGCFRAAATPQMDIEVLRKINKEEQGAHKLFSKRSQLTSFVGPSSEMLTIIGQPGGTDMGQDDVGHFMLLGDFTKQISNVRSDSSVFLWRETVSSP